MRRADAVDLIGGPLDGQHVLVTGAWVREYYVAMRSLQPLASISDAPLSSPLVIREGLYVRSAENAKEFHWQGDQ